MLISDNASCSYLLTIILDDVNATIMEIILWDFSMFYQILLSPQVKRSGIISNKTSCTRVAPRIGKRLDLGS